MADCSNTVYVFEYYGWQVT